MILTVEQLEEMLHFKEGELCEFKEAKTRYDFEKLVKYCAALANEGGGDFVLGVTDKRPRRVVGTRAFRQPERTRASLIQHLHLNVDFSVLNHPDGRVLVFHVPSRPLGTPVKYKGIYWQREGDSLVPMSEDRLREIFTEAGSDFSAGICDAATIDDLDPASIEDFRRRWIAKSGNNNLATLSHEQLLNDVEALVDGKLTYAALILFGTRKALGKYLAQS